jgi:integrase
MPDLSLYRRHSDSCTGKFHLKPNPQDFTKCKCPIYAYGCENGKIVRRSMKTRDWERAKRMLNGDVEAIVNPAPPAKTIASAIEEFIADCQHRHLDAKTIRSYKTILHQVLLHFGVDARISEITLESLSTCRASFQNNRAKGGARPLTSQGALKVLKRLRAFCGFCADRGWITDNYARKLKAPKQDGMVTQPFTPEQVKVILGAAKDNARDLAIVMTLLYTGMRIGDASMLRRDQVDCKTGELLIRQQKTRVNTYVKLHRELLTALCAVPDNGTPYLFWKKSPRAVTRRFYLVLERAGVTGHPHMCRDTFAVELLKNGEDIRTVQLLLGHASVTTTERHYAPWVKSFQTRLDNAVTKLGFASVDKPGRRRKRVSE